MTMKDLISEVLKLNPDERRYVGDLALSSLGEGDRSWLTAAEQQHISERLQAYEKNPTSFLSWDDVKAQLAKQRANSK